MQILARYNYQVLSVLEFVACWNSGVIKSLNVEVLVPNAKLDPRTRDQTVERYLSSLNAGSHRT